MRTPEQVKWDYIQQWLEKAEQDLQTAMLLEKNTNEVVEIIAFHCQQSVEKFLKAALICRQIEFGKTHNIEVIRNLLTSTDPELAEELSFADWLTPMAVEYRYPGNYDEVTPDQKRNLIPTASQVKKLILKFLDSYLKKGRST